MTLEQRRLAVRDAIADFFLSVHQEITPRDEQPAAEDMWDAANAIVENRNVMTIVEARLSELLDRVTTPHDRIVAAAREVQAALEREDEDALAIARTTRQQADRWSRSSMRAALAQGIVAMNVAAGAPIEGLRKAASAVANRTKNKDLASALLQVRLCVWALKHEPHR